MISTRLTDRFGLDHPIVLAPMANAAGGELAAAVTRAGGLGLIGGGYGDADWIAEEFAQAGTETVGCGLITWALSDALTKTPSLLDQILARQPTAVFLSFGDPAAFVDPIQTKGVPLICQVQCLRDAKHAADLGADVIVAQGSEAGGHGELRATMTLVPEVADFLARSHPETLVVAAGGIADGRGLAASLMLGADGVVMGSRLWASEESLVPQTMLDAAIGATGDDTIRSSVMDIARRLNWSDRYTCRVLRNAFTDRWADDLTGLIAAAEVESAKWIAGWNRGDPKTSNTFVGEATALIDAVKPAGDLIRETVEQAEFLLKTGPTLCA